MPHTIQGGEVTDREAQKRYTRVVKMGSKWNAYIVINAQSFCICGQTTKARATWFCRMAGIALNRLINTSRNV